MTGLDVADLVGWLREQVDLDEKRALEVPETRRQWHTAGGWPESGPDAVADGRGYVAEELEACDACLIAANDPARVLAEVQSKRLLLDLHKECKADCYVVRVLALAYRDREGYRAEEWAP